MPEKSKSLVPVGDKRQSVGASVELTSLSIPTRIDALVAAKRLHIYRPVVPDTRVFDRHVWLTEEARKCLYPTRSSSGADNSRALLSRFYYGRPITEREELKHLLPYAKEVWEFRVLEKPQIRMLGWFPIQYGFIVSRYAERSDLDKKVSGKLMWDKVVAQVLRDRTLLLPGALPFTGNTYADRVGGQ